MLFNIGMYLGKVSGWNWRVKSKQDENK